MTQASVDDATMIMEKVRKFRYSIATCVGTNPTIMCPIAWQPKFIEIPRTTLQFRSYRA